MKNYRLKDCQVLIDRYVNNFGGDCTEIEEGVLGLGVTVLHDAPNKKCVVIREFYLNQWSSGHSITRYSKLPKKYRNQIDQIR